MKCKFETLFKLRVVYKSGYTHDFEVTSFTVKTDRYGTTTYEWEVATAENKPIVFGANDVAAVWQIGTRKQLTIEWGKSADQ